MLHIKDTIHLIAQCPAPRRGRHSLTNSRQLGVQSPLTRGSDHTKKTSGAFKFRVILQKINNLHNLINIDKLIKM